MSGRLLQEAQPYTVPEGGAMGILFGVLSVLLCWLGPRIKTVVGAASGFSATDFALSRYGRLMHLHVCCISCFYMYIYMVAN
ncbi:sodium solute symporter [Aureococcus anophagefferens]|nr:sodium solute symporter [Aureococcus anophagefferens]